MSFESAEESIRDAVREALEPDYRDTLRGVIERVRESLGQHPADEIYDAIVEHAQADLPHFVPDRDQLMAIAVAIQDGTVTDTQLP